MKNLSTEQKTEMKNFISGILNTFEAAIHHRIENEEIKSTPAEEILATAMGFLEFQSQIMQEVRGEPEKKEAAGPMPENVVKFKK